MKVQRPIYLETLKHKMHNGLVKVITGIRRCGKSYLLSVIFGDYLRENGVDADHIIEIPLEPEIDAFMPLYIQGNNGTNNNRVPVAVAAEQDGVVKQIAVSAGQNVMQDDLLIVLG